MVHSCSQKYWQRCKCSSVRSQDHERCEQQVCFVLQRSHHQCSFSEHEQRQAHLHIHQCSHSNDFQCQSSFPLSVTTDSTTITSIQVTQEEIAVDDDHTSAVKRAFEGCTSRRSTNGHIQSVWIIIAMRYPMP
jgi:hypothetical protein